MAITNIDGVAAGMVPPFAFYKAQQTAEGAGTFRSLWNAAGFPGAGASPPAFTSGSGYVPTNATAGAIPYTNPVSGNSYLGRLTANASTAGMVIVYDRLWACSGFNTTVTTAQNVTTPGSLTRDSGGTSTGNGVELWGEVYTAPGATGATWTVSYTNQAGTSGRTATYTHPANAESVGQMFPFTLQAGDTGVQSVQSLTCSVSSGTAGDIGITLLRRIAEVPLPLINVGAALNVLDLGMPRIYDSSCLALMVLCSTTNTGNVSGTVVLTQG